MGGGGLVPAAGPLSTQTEPDVGTEATSGLLAPQQAFPSQSFLMKSVCVPEKLSSENVNIAGMCTGINGLLFLVVHCLPTETHKLPPQAQSDHTQTRHLSRLYRVR